MSIFNSVSVPCPSCGAAVKFKAVFSLNADRRPDLRMAILDGSFQRQVCPQCQKGFRLDPEMTYIDVKRGQWIVAHPYDKLQDWEELEAKGRATFDRSYGEKASSAARAIGANMKPRIVFGWAALREKLIVAEVKLDDVILELTKAAIIRGIDEPPLGSGTELRLIDMEPDVLAVAWINGINEEIREVLRTPRSLYDEIAADTSSWAALYGPLSTGLFVDMNRMLVAAKV